MSIGSWRKTTIAQPRQMTLVRTCLGVAKTVQKTWRTFSHAITCTCTDCFGHRLVKSAEEKKEIKRTIMPSNNDNGRRIMRTIEKLRAESRDRYRQKVSVLGEARGSYAPGARSNIGMPSLGNI